MAKKDDKEQLEEDVTVETREEATEDQQIEEISPIEELQIQLQEQKDKFVRLYAEFDNYKKRTAKERLEVIKTAGQDIIKDLLPVLDDFDRAEKSIETSEEIEAVKEGFKLIKDKLFKTLSNKGLQAMQALEKDFDADLHEAITEIPAPSEELKGKIVDVIEKGYSLNDKIIRYAKVVIGK